MRKLISIICVLLFCISCKKDSIELLQLADSIMNTNCDSALTLITQADASQFRRNSSRAYYALLLTEARYKNFEPLDSDSLINTAVEYYSRKNNPQLYGRALMYKGCTLFEMLDYNGAIEAYKRAEVEFEKTSNSAMLGLINTRLGEIYEKTFASDSVAVNRYKKAAVCFHKCGDSLRISSSYQQIGQMFILIHQIDSATIYLERAIDYVPAKLRSDNVYVYYLLMKALIYGNNLDQARSIGLSLNGLNDPDINNALAEVYVNLGQLDSAYNIYCEYKKYWTKLDKLIFLKKYNSSLENYKEALVYEEIGNRYADSVADARNKANLSIIEHRFDYNRNEIKMQKAKASANIRLIIIVFMLLVIALMIVITILLFQKKKKEMQEYIASIEQLVQEKNKLSDKSLHLEEEANKEKRELYALLERRFATMQNLLDISYQYIDNPNTFVAKFRSELSQNNSSKNLLEDLCKMVDKKYNGNLSSIRQDYPNLKDSDMQIISLYCEDFTVASIAILFNTTMTGIHAKKYRITKKLNISGSLKSFVQEYHTPRV